MSVHLCVSIDCECDKGPGWRTQKPLAFAGVTEGIGNRLQPLFRRFGVKPTYLLSPEVMRDGPARETLAALAGEAELGTHLHGEFAEPGAGEPDVTRAFQCNYDRRTERQKLDSLTRLFRDCFGRAPRSFRAGRFGIGRHSLGLLQELGYAVDSSVTPHKDWRPAGAREASFLEAPSQPYWPQLDDPERIAPAPGLLLEVPVTIRPSRLAWLPVIGRRFEPRWLRPTRGSAARLVAVAKEEMAGARAPNVVLNCMFHNVEVVPLASPYAADEDRANAILRKLAALLEFAGREGIKTVGLSDVRDLFAPAGRR